MPDDAAQSTKTLTEASEGDALDARLACSDGNCLGVAKPDGFCSECGIFIGLPGAVDHGEVGRRPCPDGTCIGVIGPDGRCTECGAPAHDENGEEGTGEADEGDEAGDEGDDGETSDEEGGDETRTPCPNGACIGIIGPDGRCTECGRSVDEEEE